MIPGIVDFRGEPLYVGDRIVYASCQSNVPRLTVGEIVGFESRDEGWRGEIPVLLVQRAASNRGIYSDRPVRLTNFRGILKVPS